ncbi:hypothetical protein [Thermococcus sp. JCM 11816]|uniref:hypothetical protein n=1 Tax=Thermococcus sp. (strain JCM 11816 / KS-1) TaxID=1295125 RepID=UPI0006D0BBE8
MEDLEETLERFKDMLLGLSEREILSYWIWGGEYEEARIYWGGSRKKLRSLGFRPVSSLPSGSWPRNLRSTGGTL